MKKPRLVAVAALSASVLAGSALFATPALAADGSVEYVSEAITTPEGDSYPGGWFLGDNDSLPASAGSTPAEGGHKVTGRTLLLHGTTIEINSGDEFADLLAGAAFDVEGDATFQIPMFLNHGEEDPQFTTFRSTGDDNWTSSRSVAGFTAHAAIEEADLAEQIGGLVDDGQTVQVLAFGVLVEEGDALIRSITFDGTTYVFTTPPAEENPDPETPDEGDDEQGDDVGQDDEQADDEEAPVAEAPTGEAPVATPVDSRATFTG